jgi:hypothetical protein
MRASNQIAHDRHDQEAILRLERALEEIWESAGIGLGFLNTETRVLRRTAPLSVPIGQKGKKRLVRKPFAVETD